ncbi:SNF-related serine/threonine-protein kinase-like [Paramacrobiotus metropolitanus]|uniref:SNF-related serine/threonine-protein kinase-like n=1 Tax=Paramacrobiotus metropolitanus TaxID=2943436 RepID=UPI002445A1E8|nr:SNF-related serine/threonine-protein kinase-like [Paramacrobiotus metropolitanus]
MASSASLHSPCSYPPSNGGFHCRSQAMGCYDLMDTLGRGNFATVKKAVHVFSGEEVAVKIIDKTKLDATGRAHLLQEVRCMRLVQHPNIVRLYEIIDTPTTLFLVLELADGGDLYDYMLKNEKAMSEKTARHYFSQIVQAVEYCHQLHVVHRDLKPENVLMFRKHRMVKLTDFGFGHFCQPGISLDTSCGSLRYSSPEILFGQRYDGPAVDVWGLGILLYAMVCGRPPFMELNDSETISAIMDCRYPIPLTLSASCAHLIGRMLVKNPDQRATVAEILQHVWLQSPLPLQSPGSAPGSMDCDSPESHLATLNCPLVLSRHLSDDAHERIIKIMLDGGVAAHPDDIDCALASDEYNNITATYYLLAERLLRMQAPPPPSFEEEEFVSVSAHFGAMETDDFRGGRLNGRCRRITNTVGKRTVDLTSVAEMLEELAEEEEELLDNAMIDNSMQRTRNSASPRFSPSSNRRLVNTKSSPHLNMLNKIKEEVKVKDDDDDFLDEAFFVEMERASNDPNSLRNRERQLTSPERLKRIERSRRTRSKSGSGSSQTSSDTSDTEEVGGSTSRTTASRLSFSRHRVQPHRHRSTSSCSNPPVYSRESSENASPIRRSTPVLFHMGEEDRGMTCSAKNTNSKKRVLQHSQSLMVIPCHSGKLAAVADTAKGSRKRSSLHRPHSLPPVPHVKVLLEGNYPMAQANPSNVSPRLSSLCIRQQC